MVPLKAIADAIRDTCYEVDRTVAGLPEEDAVAWARANAIRHAHTIRAMLAHAARAGKRELRVLNASGLSCGHQDFSIVRYFRDHAGIALRWTACESPRSPYLPKERFRGYVESLGIALLLTDISAPDGLSGAGHRAYDVVLFTEIAEHLDHTAFLRALGGIREALREDGMLVLTTPNLVSLANRARILSGNGDGPYFGDGNRNREEGLYGHVVNYDARRLGRLLRDAGLRVDGARTFNSYFRRPFSREPLKWLCFLFLDAAARIGKNAGGTLFLTASRGEILPIPLGF